MTHYWWKRAYHGDFNTDPVRVWDLYKLSEYLNDETNHVYRSLYDFNDIGNDIDKEYQRIKDRIGNDKKFTIHVTNGSEYVSGGKLYITCTVRRKMIESAISDDTLIEVFTVTTVKIKCKKV